MPKFESPLGSKQFSGQQMREISVPDETNFDQPPFTRHNRRVDVQEYPSVVDEKLNRDFQNFSPQNMPKDLTDFEKNILAAKKAKREGKERLSDGARRRIEMLLDMTRLTKDVEIGGQMYRVQTLTSQELRDAVVATAEFDGSVQFIFENRKQLLARSLTIVAGVHIDEFLNSNDLEIRLEFIENMDHALLNRLFAEYNSLAQEAQNKYSPKTEAQVKEVAEDLKK